MDTFWFFEDVNLFNLLCPHKFKAYKQDHDFNQYKKEDYIYFEEDNSNKVFLIEKGKPRLIGFITRVKTCNIDVHV